MDTIKITGNPKVIKTIKVETIVEKKQVLDIIRKKNPNKKQLTHFVKFKHW